MTNGAIVKGPMKNEKLFKGPKQNQQFCKRTKKVRLNCSFSPFILKFFKFCQSILKINFFDPQISIF
jgi:hypothetical protein